MGKRILIVDDSATMRTILKDTLTQNGYEIAGEATNGKEAVIQYENLQPDLVLMDTTMPEMDGVEALKKIKASDPRALIIMCSAYGQQAMVIEATTAGAKDFIVKPYETDHVLATVKKALEKPAAIQKTRSHYVDWSIVFMEIGAIIAAFIFTKGTPLYIYTIEHHREINFLLKPVFQLAAIAASTLGGGAALGLMLVGISPPLLFLGGIAGGIGGLITIFCYEEPEVYIMAVNIAKVVAVLAVIEIVFQLMRSLVGRK